MVSLIINIVVILVGVAGFAIQMVQASISDQRNGKLLDRVTNIGWGTVIIALITLIAGISGIVVSYREKQQAEIADTTKDGKYNRKIDGLRDQNNNLTERVDSFRNSFKDSLASTAFHMSKEFGQGVIHGDSNTVKILADALSNKTNLQRVIDSLRHNLDSLTGGKPVVQPSDYYVKVDTIDNDYVISFDICNAGNQVAIGTIIDVACANKQNLNKVLKIASWKHSFSINDCWDFHAPIKKDFNVKGNMFYYRIRFESGTVIYYRVHYNFKLKTWAMLEDNYSEIFN